MNDRDWKTFFLVCANALGVGHATALHSRSWCSWTTFQRLNEDAGYWTAGLPREMDIADTHIKDGGVWGQPFSYAELAHIIVPQKFLWESVPGPDFTSGFREQDIKALSSALTEKGIGHRATDLVLEIKLY
jgi:hypothetical protein